MSIEEVLAELHALGFMTTGCSSHGTDHGQPWRAHAVPRPDGPGIAFADGESATAAYRACLDAARALVGAA